MLEKKDIASELLKNAPRLPGIDLAIRNRLNKVKDRPEPKDNNSNFSPPSSPTSPPPSFFSQRPPPGPPPAPPFVPPPSGNFLQPF